MLSMFSEALLGLFNIRIKYQSARQGYVWKLANIDPDL